MFTPHKQSPSDESVSPEPSIFEKIALLNQRPAAEKEVNSVTFQIDSAVDFR